jgi:hypothetical protein
MVGVPLSPLHQHYSDQSDDRLDDANLIGMYAYMHNDTIANIVADHFSSDAECNLPRNIHQSYNAWYGKACHSCGSRQRLYHSEVLLLLFHLYNSRLQLHQAVNRILSTSPGGSDKLEEISARHPRSVNGAPDSTFLH